MKIFVWLLLVAATSVFASPSVAVYFETTADGYTVFADNNEVCPVAIRLDLTLVNLSSEKGDHALIVVPSEAKQFQINTLSILSKLQGHQFSHTVTSYFGDPHVEEYDVVFEYALPFKKGESYKMLQATEDGKEFAIDFAMPLGTEITAVRGGTVVEVVAENNKGCAEADCGAFENYVLVYHKDGTFAAYSGLKNDGALVRKGDHLSPGDLVGYSGETGRTTVPKLHLEIFLPNGATRKVLKANFILGDGNDHGILIGGTTYARNY